jgi:nicotinate-nucleotide adenylyltransferase
MEIALFGGSFDPPHVGHQMACLYVLATEPVDEVWLVPVHEHAFGKPLSPFSRRVEMCRLALEPFGPRARVSEVEGEMGGVSRTADTVRHLMRQRPGDRFALVIGADVLRERAAWYEVESLDRLVRYIVLGRAGYEGGLLDIPDVSSTEVRRRIAAGEPCDHLVARPVLDYIRERGLYR